MNFFKSTIASIAVAGTFLFVTAGCSKENIQPTELAVANQILQSVAVKKDYAKKIADAFYDIVYIKNLYMPTLIFKGQEHKFESFVSETVDLHYDATFSLTTLTNPTIVGHGKGRIPPSFTRHSIRGRKVAVTDYFLKMAALESVSVEFMADLLDHLNRAKNELPSKAPITKADYAHEIAKVFCNVAYQEKNYMRKLNFKDGSYSYESWVTFSGTGKKDNAELAFTIYGNLTNPQVTGTGKGYYHTAEQNAVEDYFLKASEHVSIYLMMDLLDHLNRVKLI